MLQLTALENVYKYYRYNNVNLARSYRNEWIDAINKVSKELRKTDVETAKAKPAAKTEGATIAKQGIKVHIRVLLDIMRDMIIALCMSLFQTMDDFEMLKVLGKGTFGKVSRGGIITIH